MKKSAITTIPEIKPGDVQPSECPNCLAFNGYQYLDYMKIHYATIHNADGSEWGGAYSESINIIHQGVSAHCANCGARLLFKVNRK